MQLFYKEWDKTEVEIPQGAIISDKGFIDCMRGMGTPEYPYFYCWEVWIIHKIAENKDGYFDFSKNLVDIGAGLAEYCWLLPFKHSYAFEPNKKMEYLIHANLVLHDKVDSVDTFRCLLSDKKGIVNFDGFRCEGLDWFEEDKSTQQQTKILDDFGIDNVGLIKIDVEGMEEKVLKGGLGTIIRSNYPPILFECWDAGINGLTQEKRDSLFNLLKSLGYEILEYWGDFETHLAIHK